MHGRMLEVTRRVLPLAAALSVLSLPLQAREASGPELMAVGVVAYQQTKDRCEYAPSVGPRFAQLDENYAESSSAEWEQLKRQAKASLVPAHNIATIIGQSQGQVFDDCKTFGISIGDALAISLIMIGPDPEIEREAGRLSNAGGKPRAGETPLQQSSPGDRVWKPTLSTADQAVEHEVAHAVREILARDLSNVLVAVDRENDDERFMTPDLLALWDKGARAFDADPYTGVQDLQGLRLEPIKVQVQDRDHASVTARFDTEGNDKAHLDVRYAMLRTNGHWLINDIDYLTQGGPSFRRFLESHQSSDQ